MRVGFDPYDESPIKRRGEEYLEHEFHEGQSTYEPYSPETGTPYDYEGYPSGRASSPYSRSRPGTPIRSTSSSFYRTSTPNDGERTKSSTELPVEGRATLENLASPSPLLRRATAQPNHGKNLNLKQPSFRGPPTAPHTSSSPRLGQPGVLAQSFRGSVALDTPPSSIRKEI
jgi:hypothetical protein